eukprot:PhF_6_TR19013/c0_g1_i1/m.27874
MSLTIQTFERTVRRRIPTEYRTPTDPPSTPMTVLQSLRHPYHHHHTLTTSDPNWIQLFHDALEAAGSNLDDAKVSPLKALGQLLSAMKPGDGLPAQLPVAMYVPYSMCMSFSVMATRIPIPNLDPATTTPKDRFIGLVVHTLQSVCLLPPYGVRPLESILGETCSVEGPGFVYQCEHVGMNPPDTYLCLHAPGVGFTMHRRMCVDTKFTGLAVAVKSHGYTKIQLNKTNELFECDGPDVAVRILSSYSEFVGSMTCTMGTLKAVINFPAKPTFGGKVGRVEGTLYDTSKSQNPGEAFAKLEGSWLEGGTLTIDGKVVGKMPCTDVTSDFNRLVQQPFEPTHSYLIWRHITDALYKKQYGKAARLRKVIDGVVDKNVHQPFEPKYFRKTTPGSKEERLSGTYVHTVYSSK